MRYIVTRYNIDKLPILTGELTVEQDGQSIRVTYTDKKVNVFATELYHPLVALEHLRRKLEDNHNSLLGINGCRIDTAFRATGRSTTYLIEPGKPTTISKIVDLFEPTNEVDKLCTVGEHKKAYAKWIETIKQRE